MLYSAVVDLVNDQCKSALVNKDDTYFPSRPNLLPTFEMAAFIDKKVCLILVNPKLEQWS